MNWWKVTDYIYSFPENIIINNRYRMLVKFLKKYDESNQFPHNLQFRLSIVYENL